jgi:hypothetical protein
MNGLDVTQLYKDARCKVCKMSQTAQPLFLELHRRYILEGVATPTLHPWLNKEIEALNQRTAPGDEGLPFVSTTGVNTHFQKHVSVAYVTQARMKRDTGDMTRKQPMDPEVAGPLREMANQARASVLDDLQRMATLSETVERRFYDLDKSLNVDGLSLDSAGGYAAFANGLAKIIEQVAKLRNQDKIVQAALTSCMDSFSLGALQMLMRGIDLLMNEYRPHFRDPAMADHFAYKLRELVGVAMTESAKSSLDQVRSQMKIA